MELYRIDIREVRTRKELHEKISEALPLPDYYGNNLDALFDVLTECGEERTIVFIVNENVEEALGKYYAALQAMCGAAADENPELTILFDEETDHDEYEEEY